MYDDGSRCREDAVRNQSFIQTPSDTEQSRPGMTDRGYASGIPGRYSSVVVMPLMAVLMLRMLFMMLLLPRAGLIAVAVA